MTREPALPAGVTAEAWSRLGAVPDGDGWKLPERDAGGEIVGWARRFADGSKGFESGGRRGLTLSWPLPSYAGASRDNPVLIVEGASDAAAGLGLGFETIGRPSAFGGGELLKSLLRGLHVCIVAENDSGPGRAGADRIAQQLAPVCHSVRVVTPPAAIKDLREWIVSGATAEMIQQAIDRAAPLGDAASNRPGPKLRRLSEVVPKSINWLWPGRIAIGKLTLIAGDPGLGKSFMTLDIAARVSRGRNWPDRSAGAAPIGGVVVLNAEDDLEDTIVPRLEAAGAAMERIVALQAVSVIGEGGQEAGIRQFDLARDLAALETAIRSTPGCRLVIIDPITAYLGSVDSHKNADVRSLLAPLSELAARLNVAVVAVTHLNKSAGQAAIYRTMGSLAFTAAARAAWAVVKDKEDEIKRLFLPIKNNIAPDSGGLGFQIVPQGPDSQPVVVWDSEPVQSTADQALTMEAGEKSATTALDEAVEWLRDMLSDGPRSAKEIKEQSQTDGIKARTLDRAKSKLGVSATREGYASGGRWLWVAPHSAPTKSIERQPVGLALNGENGALCRASHGRSGNHSFMANGSLL